VGPILYNGKLKHNSSELRKKMTDAERKLWSKLRLNRLKGCQFYRQRIIGSYIVDFFCLTEKLVIEVDGSQHYSDEMIKADKVRDKYLNEQGLQVLRFNDADVLRNPDGVVDRIFEYLKR
jgi:very-short-patch-repair endonuclease